MTEPQDSEDTENAQVRNLAAAAAELLERAATAPAGRAPLTLIPRRGRVGLVAGSGHWGWGTGDHIQIRPRGTG